MRAAKATPTRGLAGILPGEPLLPNPEHAHIPAHSPETHVVVSAHELPGISIVFETLDSMFVPSFEICWPAFAAPGNQVSGNSSETL